MKGAASIMKGAYHLAMARTYFDSVRTVAGLHAKHVFNGYINKCDWVIKDIKTFLPPESSALLRQEIEQGDVMFFGAIAEKCAHLDPQQREGIEKLIDAIIAGETIQVEQVKEEQ